MRIEFRKSGGESCPGCGATELLHVPALNQHLERDLAALFTGPTRWWQLRERHLQARMVVRMEQAVAELRDLTRRDFR